MDTRTILADLKSELNRINQAIAALESLGGAATATPGATATIAKSVPQPEKLRLTPAARKRISEAAKKRWAERKVTTTLIGQTAPKKASGRRTVSAASRKKMAEAQRKRWAAKKTGTPAKQATVATKAAPAPKPMSAAVKKRLSQLAKARWAQRKKAAKA